jgi:hypothetical protein
MNRPLSLSFIALCVFTNLSCTALAQQELVPIFQLSAEETAKASHLAQDLKNAHQRYDNARTTWRVFQETYQSAHPDLPNVQFTSDFRLAFTSQNPAAAFDPQLITPVALTSKEQQQLKDLHQEMAESWQSLQQAEKNWMAYQHQLAATHFPTKVGNQAVVSPPWANGLAFTPDFRFAVPRTH